MFHSNSGLVKLWVSAVKSSTYTLDQVPVLLNLKDVVTVEINKVEEK